LWRKKQTSWGGEKGQQRGSRGRTKLEVTIKKREEQYNKVLRTREEKESIKEESLLPPLIPSVYSFNGGVSIMSR